jgi:hypothetical protein
MVNRRAVGGQKGEAGADLPRHRCVSGEVMAIAKAGDVPDTQGGLTLRMAIRLLRLQNP